nr:MAG TPA: hypothetical protein [Caudoviricetes sp.]
MLFYHLSNVLRLSCSFFLSSYALCDSPRVHQIHIKSIRGFMSRDKQ